MKKKCVTCETIKDGSEFNNNIRARDGKEFECRKCSQDRTKKRLSQPGYNSYRNAVTRCKCKKSSNYKNYGGRGITLDHTFDTYKAFWNAYKDIYNEALEKYPNEKLEIDRIDNNGNYELGNIRFVPRKVNQNNKRDNINVTIKDTTMTLSQWCDQLKFPKNIAYTRKKNNWPDDLLFINLDNPMSAAIAITRHFSNK